MELTQNMAWRENKMIMKRLINMEKMLRGVGGFMGRWEANTQGYNNIVAKQNFVLPLSTMQGYINPELNMSVNLE